MTIYRGPGGGGNADSDAEINALTALTNQALAYSEAAGLEAEAAALSAADASTSADSAATSASGAATSESNAAGSASSASTSETSAAASASGASTSASSASASASNAASSASAASTSATNAAASETNAAASAASALTYSTASAASAVTASTQAGLAATSASAAAGSAVNAATSETNAAASEAAAATSATNAATSATNAASSATAAANSAASIDPSTLVRNNAAGTINVNSTSDALRITQTGTGNAFVVEDASPDASPFVIDTDGRTLIGNSVALTTRVSTTSISPFLQVAGASTERAQVGIFAANANPSFLFAKSNGSVNTPTVVTDSQLLGRVSAAGYDGTQFTEAANIIVSVDGTPGTNDMPGRILFSTTPDGGVTPVERLTIDSAGTVTLAATSGLSIGRTAVTSPATTDGNVFSGTYTPTLTNVTNVAASTASVLQYMRVGNYVQASGRVAIDPTVVGTTTLRMSVPVASNFGSVVQAGGTFSGPSGEIGFITAVSATDDLQFQYTATSTANNTFQFTVGYQVI